MRQKFILGTICLCFSLALVAQVQVQGYAYESGNRGYLYGVNVKFSDSSGNQVALAKSNNDGFFETELPAAGTYTVDVSKDFFETQQHELEVGEKKEFLKYELKRKPGYVFEITLAEARESEDIVVDQIKGSLIEVYNNTTREVEQELKDYQGHEFRVNMQQGNHYTIMVRKKGYLAKRMEAYVNVKGCILCFEGVGEVRPGVTPNLTEGNQNGVLLANVELDSVFRGKKFPINDLYYDLGKWDLKTEAEEELDKVITMLQDNPHLTIELGSHTDSRGSAKSNMELSEKRARSAVNYLRSRGVISSKRIISKGYGEEEIKNGCKDGVDCTEAMHAQNRRTELKIVGIDNDGSIKKTLAEMKREEHMEELLAEITAGGQVRVTGDDTLAYSQSTTDDSPIIQPPQIVDDSGLDARGGRDLPKVEKMPVEEAESSAPAQAPSTNSSGSIQMPSSSYTGYKIIIHEAIDPISNDNQLWTKHSGLEVFFNGRRFLYGIGAFASQAEAEAARDSGIKLEYPESSVVQIQNGQIIN